MTKEKIKSKDKDILYYIFYAIVGSICVFLLFIRFFLHPVTVVGESMSPTYHDGQILATDIFDPETNTLSVDDIIVFSASDLGKNLIKRVVAVGGDTVQIVDGLIYRNGELVEDEFPEMENAGIAESVVYVPDGYIFVLGDNRNHSTDSRKFGIISVNTVTSVVTRVLYGK